jgi:Lrp/AsnC family leucine-responsive transcriptional regulator
MIDHIDLEILSLIQESSRVTNVEIARNLKMAPSAVLERVRKLRAQKIIEEHVTRLNPAALGMGLLAYVFIKTNENRNKWDVGQMIARIPEVLEVHDVAGEDCYIVKLRTRDTKTLFELLRDKVGKIPAIGATRTTIVLRTVKETTRLPIEAAAVFRDSGVKIDEKRPARRRGKNK